MIAVHRIASSPFALAGDSQRGGSCAGDVRAEAIYLLPSPGGEGPTELTCAARGAGLAVCSSGVEIGLNCKPQAPLFPFSACGIRSATGCTRVPRPASRSTSSSLPGFLVIDGGTTARVDEWEWEVFAGAMLFIHHGQELRNTIRVCFGEGALGAHQMPRNSSASRGQAPVHSREWRMVDGEWCRGGRLGGRATHDSQLTTSATA